MIAPPTRRRAVTRSVAFALLLASAPCVLAAGPPPSAGTERFDGGVRIDLEPGGALVDIATTRASDGTRSVWVLVGDPPAVVPADDDAKTADADETPACAADEAPPGVRVVRVAPFAADGTPQASRAVVIEGAAASWLDAVDLDGDGFDELLLGIDDRIERLDGLDGARRVVLADPALADGRPTLIGRRDAAAWLRLAGIADDRYLRYEASSGRFVEVVSLATRTEVGRQGEGLVIWSPYVAPVPRAHDPTGPLLATAPRVIRDRVQVDLVRPNADDPALRRVECWGRLPAAERPIERFVRMLDGDPVAIVTTIPAGGLNLFGEKKLRVVPLRRDRSRRGVAPWLAVESRVNVWQPIEPQIHDLDGDGRDDLVLAYWKGLKDDRVVLDVYTRNRAGGFEMRPRGVAFDVKRGDRSFVAYGRDATGDGRPDLILAGDATLQLFAGTGNAARPVRRTATAAVPIGDPCEGGDQSVEIGVGSAGANVRRGGPDRTPLLEDLDGDGRVEVILRRAGCGGPALQIVRFDAPASGRP